MNVVLLSPNAFLQKGAFFMTSFFSLSFLQKNQSDR